MTARLRVLCASMILVLLAALHLMAQGAPDRSHPPPLAPASRLTLPPIQKRMLANGLPVWIVESHEVPVVQISLVVLAGANDDPPGRYGLAGFTAAMLDEGAGTRSALEISDGIDFLGASLSTGSSFDASVVRLNVPASRLEQALPILADVVRRPTFPRADLERIREERLTTLLQARDDPASVASMAFSRALFGPAHRYGTPITGDEKTLKAIAAEDLRGFHAAFYEPSNATVIVVGDVVAETVLGPLERTFGDWKHTAPIARPSMPPAPAPGSRQVLLVDKADAEQSQIRIGGPGAPRNTPDYFALQVLNTVLGGSFTSRLNQNLRETHGYAYFAGSDIDFRLFPGPLVAYGGVQTDKTADALREFFKELAGIAKPVASDELAKAKNYIALSFPSELETTADLSRRLEELAVYKLPEHYFDEYVARIQAVSAADVEKAAAKYIHPERFVVVVAGDRKAIEPAVRMLNLGPVRVLTVEAALGM